MSAPSVNNTTECKACGHSYGLHCESGMPHFDSEDHRYSCIFAHCTLWHCQCWAFVNPHTGLVTAWRRPVTEDTPCDRCQHPKKNHCRKGATGIVVDGVPRGCKHYLTFLRDDASRDPCCDSTACAEVENENEATFCPCSKFVSPYSKKKKREKPMPLFEADKTGPNAREYLRQQEQKTQERAQTQPPSHARILIEVATEDRTLTVNELVEASGHSATWVRRTLKKAGIVLLKPPRQSRSRRVVPAPATGEELRP